MHSNRRFQGVAAVFIVLLLVIGVVVAVAVILLKKKVQMYTVSFLTLCLTHVFVEIQNMQDQETRRYVDSVVSSYLPMEDDKDDDEEGA